MKRKFTRDNPDPNTPAMLARRIDVLRYNITCWVGYDETDQDDYSRAMVAKYQRQLENAQARLRAIEGGGD